MSLPEFCRIEKVDERTFKVYYPSPKGGRCNEYFGSKLDAERAYRILCRTFEAGRNDGKKEIREVLGIK